MTGTALNTCLTFSKRTVGNVNGGLRQRRLCRLQGDVRNDQRAHRTHGRPARKSTADPSERVVQTCETAASVDPRPSKLAHPRQERKRTVVNLLATVPVILRAEIDALEVLLRSSGQSRDQEAHCRSRCPGHGFTTSDQNRITTVSLGKFSCPKT